MISAWTRAARRRPLPDLDLANPNDAYRRTTQTTTAVHRDPERDMAATMAEWFREDLAHLARHTETMSPWEAARKALRDEERA